jgi:hypothetical protein
LGCNRLFGWSSIDSIRTGRPFDVRLLLINLLLVLRPLVLRVPILRLPVLRVLILRVLILRVLILRVLILRVRARRFLIAARGLARALRIGRVIHDPKIMLGKLIVAFRSNPVARGMRIASQRQVLFIDLRRVASDTNIRAMAVECLRPRRDMLFSIRSAAWPPRVVSWSHLTVSLKRKKGHSHLLMIRRRGELASSLPRSLSWRLLGVHVRRGSLRLMRQT